MQEQYDAKANGTLVRKEGGPSVNDLALIVLQQLERSRELVARIEHGPQSDVLRPQDEPPAGAQARISRATDELARLNQLLESLVERIGQV